MASTRPFADAALDLAARGLAVVPCPGDDGKSPRGAVNFQHWRSPPSAALIVKLIEKHGDANIGIITSLSNVTIVDIDSKGDEHVYYEMLLIFGQTPLVTRTPSGGWHLWYRGGRERSANLRSTMGLPVDIKGSASAGIVIVPPSFRRSKGIPYLFAKGSWDDLHHLPRTRPGSLVASDQPRFRCIDGLREGNRNNALFSFALREACNCDDLTSLMDALQSVNARAVEPLCEAEVEKIARSAWRYEANGQNWGGT